MRVLSYNRNMGRWQLRDEAGTTDEPVNFTASCEHCGTILIESQMHEYDAKHLERSPQMGIAHGSLKITDDLRIDYVVPHRNLP